MAGFQPDYQAGSGKRMNEVPGKLNTEFLHDYAGDHGRFSGGKRSIRFDLERITSAQRAL
jgi:hypothetical protein